MSPGRCPRPHWRCRQRRKPWRRKVSDGPLHRNRTVLRSPPAGIGPAARRGLRGRGRVCTVRNGGLLLSFSCGLSRVKTGSRSGEYRSDGPLFSHFFYLYLRIKVPLKIIIFL